MRTFNKTIGLSLIAASLVACSSKKEFTPKVARNFSKNEVLAMGDKKTLKEYFDKQDVDFKIVALHKETEAYSIRFEASHSIDVKAVAKQLLEEKVARIAQPNYHYDIVSTDIQNAKKIDPYTWPNDPYYIYQWGLSNIGQSVYGTLPGNFADDIGYLEAAAKFGGGSDFEPVTVAVVDTGCDYKHPDFYMKPGDWKTSSIWVNEKELSGVAGDDDDGNGYTDDVYGYDFTSERRDGDWKGRLGDPDPMDSSGHGTHVAGLIGAKGGNKIGVIGVAQNVKIMCLRALGASGGSAADLYKAILYAVDNGADIINASWGGGNKDAFIATAISKADDASVLFVAAAGNETANVDAKPHYPSGYEKDPSDKDITNILTVGASDGKDNSASFSNYGSNGVDVFAPGVKMLSLYPTQMGGYVFMGGTSMSAPLVTGMVAYMMGVNPKFRKNPELVIQTLIATSVKKAALLGLSKSNGRVSLFNALTKAEEEISKIQWAEESHSFSRGEETDLIDARHKITKEGAQAIKVHFDFIHLDAPYNSIWLYDKHYRFIEEIPVTSLVGGEGHWSAIVPGDTAIVRYVNSLVKIAGTQSISGQSLWECEGRGGEDLIEDGESSGSPTYTCTVDQEIDQESIGGSVSLRSMGFSIDKIATTQSYDQVIQGAGGTNE